MSTPTISEILLEHAKGCRKALLITNDETRISEYKFVSEKAEQALKAREEAAIAEAVRLAKIDTLKITHGHLQTGTVLTDDYFIHNITNLEQQATPTTEKGKSDA